MRYIVKKPNTETAPVKATPDFGISASTDVAALLDKASSILSREIANLMMESSGGKLSPTSSKSLVDYIKLLHSLKEEQIESLSELTDAELLVQVEKHK